MKVDFRTEHLNEKILGEVLHHIFPGKDFIKDKIYQPSKTRFRPDFLCEELKLVVEFNGYLHYTSSDQILRDRAKKQAFNAIGFKLVEIPYFVQLDETMLNHYFKEFGGVNFNEVASEYLHGFHHPKALLPIDYSRWGFDRFKMELEILPTTVKEDIIKSLERKKDELGKETY